MLSSGIVCCGLGIDGMGLITQPAVSATLFGLFAAAIVAVNVVLGTVRHSLVPSEFLGRVLGVWRTVAWGAVPVGALLGGLLTRARHVERDFPGLRGAADRHRRVRRNGVTDVFAGRPSGNSLRTTVN